MRIFKKVIPICVAMVMICATALPAMAEDTAVDNSAPSISAERIVFTKYISDFPVFYQNRDAIPDTYNYYQYSEAEGSYFSGTLTLYEIGKVDGGWMAHYHGNVVGLI